VEPYLNSPNTSSSYLYLLRVVFMAMKLREINKANHVARMRVNKMRIINFLPESIKGSNDRDLDLDVQYMKLNFRRKE
jgi:hypothetical protein